MSKTKWFSGPPPSVGWWPASRFGDKSVVRWWNGKWWSEDCWDELDIDIVEIRADREASFQNEIHWTHRPSSWPERSRT